MGARMRAACGLFMCLGSCLATTQAGRGFATRGVDEALQHASQGWDVHVACSDVIATADLRSRFVRIRSGGDCLSLFPTFTLRQQAPRMRIRR